MLDLAAIGDWRNCGIKKELSNCKIERSSDKYSSLRLTLCFHQLDVLMLREIEHHQSKAELSLLIA